MGEARVGVSVLVFRGEGAEELLLVLRSKAPAEGLWAPPGGRLEFGERLVEAAHREVREESGLTITLADEPLLDVVDLIEHQGDVVHVHYVLIQLVARCHEERAPRAGDDAADCRWVPVDRLVSAGQTVEGLGTLVARARERLRQQEGRPAR